MVVLNSKLFYNSSRQVKCSAMQHQNENDGRSSVGSSCSNKSIRDVRNLSASDAENSDFYLNESDEEANKHEFEDESGCKFQLFFIFCGILILCFLVETGIIDANFYQSFGVIFFLILGISVFGSRR